MIQQSGTLSAGQPSLKRRKLAAHITAGGPILVSKRKSSDMVEANSDLYFHSGASTGGSNPPNKRSRKWKCEAHAAKFFHDSITTCSVVVFSFDMAEKRANSCP